MAHASLLQADASPAVGTLNALLRNEHAAVDTYENAIDRLDGDTADELSDCLLSHRLRGELLAERILELHGRPVERGGSCGSFMNLFVEEAELCGREAIFDALLEGEERAWVQYSDALAGLDRISRRLVEQDLLPEQHRTLLVMGSAASRSAPGGATS